MCVAYLFWHPRKRISNWICSASVGISLLRNFWQNHTCFRRNHFKYFVCFWSILVRKKNAQIFDYSINNYVQYLRFMPEYFPFLWNINILIALRLCQNDKLYRETLKLLANWPILKLLEFSSLLWNVELICKACIRTTTDYCTAWIFHSNFVRSIP